MNNTIAITELDLEYSLPKEYALNTTTAESYIMQLKTINKLPFNKGDIYYSDNLWDFTPYTTLNVSKRKMKFNFERVNAVFKDDVKNYVLVKILENKCKVQSINRSFGVLCRFFNHIQEKHFYDVKDISSQSIRGFLNQQEEKSVFEIRRAKTVIYDFYTFYSTNFTNILTSEMKDLLDLGDYRAFKAIKEQNKTTDIPADYFDKLISILIKIIDEHQESIDYRATACITLILSQTGLRIGEVLSLDDGCLETIKIFNGEETNYIKYKTWKRENGNNIASIAKTYVNELTKKGYNALLELHKEKREKLNMNFLYMGGSSMNNTSQFPISPDAFNRQQRKFYCYIDKYIPTTNLPQEQHSELQPVNVINDYTVNTLNKDATTLTYPKNHQFRVHVCTELYNKGVPLKYIQKFMAHLSTEMQGYYVRPTKSNPQEDMDFTLKTFEKIVSGENKLLGGSTGLTEKIQEFIKENNYKIETDMKSICEKLSVKIPVRQKTGGVCIKSSMLRECSTDAKTNEFYCAYGVCPNIFHFYYMADVSYRQSKELTETIEINKHRGHLRQVQKEMNMLQTIVKQKLVPELDELKNMITKKGVQAILQEYPDLQYIIENLDTIYQEVEIWKSMIL